MVDWSESKDADDVYGMNFANDFVNLFNFLRIEEITFLITNQCYVFNYFSINFPDAV